MRSRLMHEMKNCLAASIYNHALPTASFETPLPVSSPPMNALRPHTSPRVTPPPAAPPVNDLSQASSSTHYLSIGAMVGIGIGTVASILILAFCLLSGIPYLRSRRRERALQRAVEEVERGVEMQKSMGHASDAMSESKENMVLESRVEILIDDGMSERNAIEAWDGWDGRWTEDDDLERGRKGMSLPRREY
jgi:hypothetical protein